MPSPVGYARLSLAALVTELPESAHARVLGDDTVLVTDVSHDSRAVQPGSIYACLRGEHYDGHRFAAAAVGAGASSLLVDHPLEIDVSQLLVDDTRLAIGPIAAAVHGRPSTAMRVVGVTGTNGKTTTTHLLAAVLRAAGMPTGVIGTLSGTYTTPEAPELQTRLEAFRADGDEAVVMEVSSHALAMHRVDGTRFAAAVFTNLGTDHLDLHGTAEEYFRAKARLFAPELSDVGLANIDDAHGRLLYDAAPIEIVPFSRADVSDVDVGAAAHAYTWRGVRIVVPIGGEFNVMNSLAAATTAGVLGIEPAVVAAGLAAAEPVPGRFERVQGGDDHGITVLVDYAHTPDGLEEVIAAGQRVAAGGRVIVVFGCGGDRDRDKRPRMGGTAARLADLVTITSDNPRSESPAAIIDAILSGVDAADRRRVTTEPDRAAAIAGAIASAGVGDVVIIAGKGHETTQTFGDRVIAFDDREEARRALEARR